MFEEKLLRILDRGRHSILSTKVLRHTYVLSIVQVPSIKEVMTPSPTTNQTPRRSTRGQPDAISNRVSKNTPSAKNSENSKTTRSLKSTKDSSTKIVKNAEQIVKNLPSSREERLVAEAEGSGSSLSDLDSLPGEEDSAPDLNHIQSRYKSGERYKSLMKVKVVEDQALGAEPRQRKRAIKEESVKVEGVVVDPTSKNSSRKRKIEKLSIEEEEKAEIPEDVMGIEAKPKQKKTEREENIEDGGDLPEKPTRKRKTKEEKVSEMMPLAARTNGLKMFVGAHVSSAKGVHNAITNCLHIGGNAFAFFLKSQRKWENPPLQDEHKKQFRALAIEHKYDPASHILPHGSYLVNLAQEDPTKATQAYNAFLDDLKRCEALGIKFYNFHPGSTGPSPRPAAIARIASHLNAAHAATTSIIPLLETMAGSGNVIGSTFTDLADIISLVQDKSRIGVCLDTCHVFAAGYDLRDPTSFNQVLSEFDSQIGLAYLKALHLNDSKTPLGSHRDLHANIGTGFLGLRAFHNVMNEARFEGLPMVLETPIDRMQNGGKMVEDKGVWAREIKLLESLVGMNLEGQEFGELERTLAKEGEGERKKGMDAFEKKMENGKKAAEKMGKGKGKIKGKRGKTQDSGSESDGSSGN